MFIFTRIIWIMIVMITMIILVIIIVIIIMLMIIRTKYDNNKSILLQLYYENVK